MRFALSGESPSYKVAAAVVISPEEAKTQPGDDTLLQ
jgi:hypothetical protein